jgi:Na+-transporting NADH:ubiquinone oxidoreductase subunit C
MSKRTDSNLYTILFAAGMVLVVGTLLAFFSSSLKPAIDENKRIEKQQNILYAMGVNENDETSAIFVSKNKVADVFSKYIKEQLVLVTENGKIVKQQNREEYMAENNNQEPYLIDVKKQQSVEKEGKPRKLPLFVGEKEGNTFYIAPIRGKGLWDAIWGYIAMDKNMVVQGVYFDHKGETPGLGANIKQRFFMDDFIGEQMMHNSAFKGIQVAKGNNDPKNIDKTDNEVDAIAGATITGDGVSAMIKSELKKYVPYFNTLKTN